MTGVAKDKYMTSYPTVLSRRSYACFHFQHTVSITETGLEAKDGKESNSLDPVLGDQEVAPLLRGMWPTRSRTVRVLLV